MGKIIIGQTPWEQISDYVLMSTDGTIYSLHPDKSLYIQNVLTSMDPTVTKILYEFPGSNTSSMSVFIPISYLDSFFTNSGITIGTRYDTTLQDQDFSTMRNASTPSGFYSVNQGNSNSNITITTAATGNTTVNISNNDTFLRNLLGVGYTTYKTSFPNGLPILVCAMSVVPRINATSYDSNSTMWYFRILRKKAKSTFLEENFNSYKYFTGVSNTIGTTASDSTTMLKNIEANYQAGSIKMDQLKKYCCQGQNFKLQECNSVYIDGKQLIGKLYYITYKYKEEKNAVNTLVSYEPDTTQAIISNGYITDPIKNIGYTTPNNEAAIVVIKGFITFPRSDTYYFQSAHDDGLVLKIGDNTIFNNLAYGTDTTTDANAKQYNAGSVPILIKLTNTGGATGMDLKYKDSTMSEYVNIPAEWYSAPYYYNLLGNYNSYLNTACGTVDKWYTSACYPLINGNPTLTGNVANNVITYCKVGGSGNNTAPCTALYNSTTSNDTIMKAYCLENNRYMTDDKCNDYIITNASRLAAASDPIKTSILNYCGQTPASGSVSNWSSGKCQNYITNVFENDQVFWDQYCITNGNLMTDYTTCKPNYIDSNNNEIAGRAANFEKKISDVCGASDIWKTNSNCNTILSDIGNKTALGTLAPKIISTCKVGGSAPTTANCTTLYKNNSPDASIKKSYCTDIVDGVPRFINDATCTTWANSNQNDSDFQSQVVNYCGANKTNLDSTNCTTFLRNAPSATVPVGTDKLDHKIYDQYCITNKNLLTDARCQTYYGTGSDAPGVEYNDALKTMCKDTWKTDTTCSSALSNNSTVLSDTNLNTSIINACKVGAPSPIPAGCANLYKNNSINSNIKKSYCTDVVDGVPRFINDSTCTTWATNNTSDVGYQSKLVDYCGKDKTNWSNASCTTLLGTAGAAVVPTGSDKLDKQLYDKYCITNMNSLVDYNTCKTRYESNTDAAELVRFKNSVINSCTKTGGIVDNTKLFSTTSCITDSAITTPPSYLTSAIDESKVNYCNSGVTFTNDNCKGFIANTANIGRFDSMLKTNCVTETNATKEPCLTIASPTYANISAIPQYGKAINELCVDTSGKFIPTDSCVARNIPDNPYYFNLMEPTLKYCGGSDATTGAANITNKVCTDYMNNNVTRSSTEAGCPVKSSFVGSRWDDNDSSKEGGCCIYNSILFFILMLVIVMLIYKHSEKMTGHPILLMFNKKCRPEL